MVSLPHRPALHFVVAGRRKCQSCCFPCEMNGQFLPACTCPALPDKSNLEVSSSTLLQCFLLEVGGFALPAAFCGDSAAAHPTGRARLGALTSTEEPLASRMDTDALEQPPSSRQPGENIWLAADIEGDPSRAQLLTESCGGEECQGVLSVPPKTQRRLQGQLEEWEVRGS